jgi:glutamate synthase domain-containing protein 2
MKAVAKETQIRGVNYELMEAMAQIAREKSVDKTILVETLEAGLLSAGRKRFGQTANIEVKFDEPSGKILMKLTRRIVEDAEEAAKTGAQAIVVSNHGGRQLDGAPSSIEVLPEIVDAVGSKMEIMFDGGIRSGQDVVRALALGAKSCMIGRAYAYGLGAGGQAGVAKALDIIAKEMLTTMGLCGVNTIAEIDDNLLAV